jgi:catechol 2,3-dioxygenase-like lactoylglutathione lyase family enzyme
MPETDSHRGVTFEEEQGFRVTMIHNPNHRVLDLDEAEGWLQRVFGCSSISIADVLSRVPSVRPDWPRDYSIYTLIRDVFFCSWDLTRFVIDGKRLFGTVDEPHLADFACSVEGHAEAYRQLKRHGIRATNSLGELGDGDDPPPGPNDPAPYSTLAEETGLRYHFYPAGAFLVDPRSAPGWKLPPVSDQDPLGIERCSHHTILTKQPGRALRLFVDALGGEVVHGGRNDLLGATSIYVHIGGSTIEFALPDSDTTAHEDWGKTEPNDAYHAITWKVVDLVRAERHLAAQGVRIRARSDDTIVTEPATSLGVPWGFSTTLVPGDPRASDW